MVVWQSKRHRRQLQRTICLACAARSRSCRRAGWHRYVDESAAILGGLCQQRWLLGVHGGQRWRIRQHDMRRHRQRVDHLRTHRHPRCSRCPRSRFLLRRRLIAQGAGARSRMAREAFLGSGKSGHGWADVALLLSLRLGTCGEVHRPSLYRTGRLVFGGGKDVCQHSRCFFRRIPRGTNRRPRRGHKLCLALFGEGPPACDRCQEPPQPGI